MRRFTRLALVPLILGFAAPRVRAATIPVTAGEVAVNTGNRACSLREAIANAESGSDTSGGDCVPGTGGPDTIELAKGSTYDLLDIYVTDPNYGNTGLPPINTDVIINGNGATIERSPTLFSDGPCEMTAAPFRIFFVGLTGTLTLNDVTLKNGCAGAGGALFNRGTATVTRSTLENNVATYSAGAIQNDGVLMLMQSTLSGNSVLAGAGGAIVNTEEMQVLQSTIDTNTTPGAGGGIFNALDTQATIANSTLSGNTSDGTGAGLQNNGGAAIVNATIAFNRMTVPAASPGFGAGIWFQSGRVTLANTIVAEQLNGTDCHGGITGIIDNLDDDGTCPAAITTSMPGLGPLSRNGGPTKTHALFPNSAAIDAGDNATCAESPVDGVDQRGVPRPQFGGKSLTCDIGAFEFIDLASQAPALSPAGVALVLLALTAIGVLRERRKSLP